MTVPPIPPPLEHLGQRPFSFYPPILGIEHNEWRFTRATWSEIQVVNTKSGQELWVPRRFLGEISQIDEPVMIVGLLKELEYKAGSVWPHDRRIIEMSRPPGSAPGPSEPASTATHTPPLAIRLEPGAESRIGRLIAAALLLGVVALFVVVSVFRGGRSGERVRYQPVLQSDLGLTAEADYYAVVRKLGAPLDDHWRSETGELQYRVLRYKDVSIILMGVERDKARYIGAKDNSWRTIDSVQLPDGRNTASMLRNLKPF